MKRIFLISRNNALSICILILSILAGILLIDRFTPQTVGASYNTPYQTYFGPSRPDEGSLEEIYQDVFMTMLLPCINKVVDNYYEKNTGYSPAVDPWQPKILYIKRPNGYRTFLFEMKVEVAPYLGAHNSIGIDHITVRVSSKGVEVLEFEHIKDNPVPPWL